MTTSIRTHFLVLRKTPYSETSLILAGISPDAGQLHFMVRGARTLSKKQFPIADILRTLAVEYRPGRGELYSWQHAELSEDFGPVARQPAAYRAAVWLAHLALANIQPGMPQPRMFTACETAFRRLAATAEAAPPGTPETAAALECVCLAARVGVGMVFLDEQGLLPDYGESPSLVRQREILLAMAENLTVPPALTLEAWQRLAEWVVNSLRLGECRLPPDSRPAGTGAVSAP